MSQPKPVARRIVGREAVRLRVLRHQRDDRVRLGAELIDQARELVLEIDRALREIGEELLQGGLRRRVDDVRVAIQDRVEIRPGDLVERAIDEIVKLGIELLKHTLLRREIFDLRGVGDECLARRGNRGLEHQDVFRQRRVDLRQAELDARAAHERGTVTPHVEERLAQPERVRQQRDHVARVNARVVAAAVGHGEEKSILSRTEQHGVERSLGGIGLRSIRVVVQCPGELVRGERRVVDVEEGIAVKLLETGGLTRRVFLRDEPLHPVRQARGSRGGCQEHQHREARTERDPSSA